MVGWGKTRKDFFEKMKGFLKKLLMFLRKDKGLLFSEKNGRWQMAVRENNRKYHE